MLTDTTAGALQAKIAQHFTLVLLQNISLKTFFYSKSHPLAYMACNHI